MNKAPQKHREQSRPNHLNLARHLPAAVEAAKARLLKKAAAASPAVTADQVPDPAEVAAAIAARVEISKIISLVRVAAAEIAAEAAADAVVIADQAAAEAVASAAVVAAAAAADAADSRAAAADSAIVKIDKNAKIVRWITCKTKWPSRSHRLPTRSSRKSS